MYICSASHARDCISKVGTYSPTTAGRLEAILEMYGPSAGYYAAMILFAKLGATSDEDNEALLQRGWDFAEKYPKAATVFRSAVRQFVRDVNSTGDSG
jgi:hypothetical protein